MNIALPGIRGVFAVVFTLSALLVAPGDGHTFQSAGQQDSTALPAVATIDRDRNKLFDDLEATIVGMTAGSTVDVLVALRAPASADRVAELEKHVGGFSTTRRFAIVDGFAATMTASQAEALALLPSVAHVELDSTQHLLNDGAQVSFGVTKARSEVPALDGDLDGNPGAYTPSDLVAAVVDSGIDANHLDLDGGKVVAFTDLVNGRTVPYDDNGHGTHVAATIAGDGDARADHLYHGVAPGAGLVGVKAFNAAGGCPTQNVIAAFEWVLANRDVYGIDAVNYSAGGLGCSDGTDLKSQAVTALVDAGVVVVVAAGNEGPGTCTVGSPAAAPAALTVGNVADTDAGGFALARDSSRGLTADGRVKPDVVAPGEDVTSAAANTANGYEPMRGTSMATPFVTGVALLMRDVDPSLTPQQVKDAMTSTAVDWGTPGPDGDYGVGRLDAYAALRTAGAALGLAGPEGPAHVFRSGTLAGKGDTFEHELSVTDLRFPIAASMTMASVTGATSANPDFDLYLLGPSGLQVASSATLSRQDGLSYSPTETGTYTVRVRSWAGSGPFFLDVSGGGPATVPGAPTGVTAALVGEEARVSWTSPGSEGGATVTGYVVTPFVGTSAQAATTVGNVTSATVGGLSVGTLYTFKVAAVNTAGRGPDSAPSNTVVVPGPPAAPTGVSATAGDGQATVSFEAPFDGGAPIVYYTATASPGGQSASGTASPVTVGGLVNGVAYTFTVTATNSLGTGPPSPPSPPVTPETRARPHLTPPVAAPRPPIPGVTAAGWPPRRPPLPGH
jgi:serine protease AprX